MRLEFAVVLLVEQMAFCADAFFDKESEAYEDIQKAIQTVKRATTSRLIEELVEHEEQNDDPHHLEGFQYYLDRIGLAELVAEYCNTFPAANREARP